MPRGFSLVELIVVVGIFIVITSVVLANHSRFNSSVLLGNAAYDIALSVRQAQVYGLSTQQYSGAFQIGYGIRFADPTSYSLFADGDRDYRYNIETGQDNILKTYTLGRGYTIKRFCGIRSDGSEDCSDNSAALSHLDVAFLRPNPDSTITSDAPVLYSSALIVLQSASGETRSVTVRSTGQISVTNP